MLYDRMTEAEKENLYNLRSYIISLERNASAREVADNRAFLHVWEMEKKRLAIMFKDSLILSMPYEMGLNPREIGDNIFASQEMDIFCQEIKNNKNIDNNTKFNLTMLSADTEALGTNVCQRSFNFSLPSGGKFTVRDKSKWAKMMKKLSTFYNLNTFDPVRERQAIEMSAEKVKGTLYLSINPIDFLTASYNQHHWTSCIDIRDGGHREGVVEMMNSPNVICAYFVADDAPIVEENGYSFSNKKWREFFIIDEKGIFGIKGYNYWDRVIEKDCLRWISGLVEDYQIFPGYIFQVEPQMFKPYNLNIGFKCGPAMYNDFYSTEYQGCFEINHLENFDIDYSGIPVCMNCGRELEEEDELNCSENLLCDCCEEHYYCSGCGKILKEDKYELNGDYYCGDCYDYVLMYICETCGDRDVVDNCTTIYITDTDGTIMMSFEACEHCYNFFTRHRTEPGTTDICYTELDIEQLQKLLNNIAFAPTDRKIIRDYYDKLKASRTEVC